MRAVHRSGFNVTVREADEPRSSSERISHTRLRERDSTQPPGGVCVTHAAAPGLLEGSQTYRVTFVSDTEYELWSGPAWLGLGTIDHVLSTPRVQLKIERGSDDAPRTGDQYDVELWPLHEIVSRVQQDLSVSSADGPAEEGFVRQVVLAVCDPSAARARALLRQLVLAYVELRPAQGEPTAELPSVAVLTPRAYAYGALPEPPSTQQAASPSVADATPERAASTATAEIELAALSRQLLARPRRWLPWSLGLSCTLAAVLAAQLASAVPSRARSPSRPTSSATPVEPHRQEGAKEPSTKANTPSLQPIVVSLEPGAPAFDSPRPSPATVKRRAAAPSRQARTPPTSAEPASSALQKSGALESSDASERLDRLDERLDAMFKKPTRDLRERTVPPELRENPYED
jgi:hypothetical protein